MRLAGASLPNCADAPERNCQIDSKCDVPMRLQTKNGAILLMLDMPRNTTPKGPSCRQDCMEALVSACEGCRRLVLNMMCGRVFGIGTRTSSWRVVLVVTSSPASGLKKTPSNSISRASTKRHNSCRASSTRVAWRWRRTVSKVTRCPLSRNRLMCDIMVRNFLYP